MATPGKSWLRPRRYIVIVILTYFPSYIFWRSTLIDLGPPRKKNSAGFKTPPPPQYAYFRACLKKYRGPFTDFWGPPKGLPPPLEKFLRAPMGMPPKPLRDMQMYISKKIIIDPPPAKSWL